MFPCRWRRASSWPWSGPAARARPPCSPSWQPCCSPPPARSCWTGKDLAGMSDVERVAMRREKIGFTFQANNLVPYLSAVENVELMLRLNNRLDKAGKLRARELLARLGLGERLQQPARADVRRAAAARGHRPRPDPQPQPGAGRRAHRQPGYRTRLPGGRDLCRADPRAEAAPGSWSPTTCACANSSTACCRCRTASWSRIYTRPEEIRQLAAGGSHSQN